MSISLQKTYVTSKPERILILDPSVNTTGFSDYQISLIDGVVQNRLVEFGLWKTSENWEDQAKLRHMTALLRSRAEANSYFGCFIELPPDTLYNESRGSQAMMIARAKSVFRTFAAAHLLAATCGLCSIPHCFIAPVQWQTHKKKRNNLPIKGWTLLHANQILRANGFTRVLSTSEDENIADAIAMGYRLIPEMLDGKWKFER